MPVGVGVLLVGSSVHGVGIGRPLQVVGLDDRGTVVGVRCLAPGRFVIIRGATWILELPGAVGHHIEVGERLIVSPSVVCSHAGDALRVRNADREPR